MKNITVARSLCVLLTLCFVILCIGCGKEKEVENNTYMDLNAYFGIENNVNNNECVIVIDNAIVGKGILNENNDIYIPYDIVRKTINNKFYVDNKDKLLIYSTPTEVFDSVIGSDTYSSDVDKKFEKTISFEKDSIVYISLDYCLLMGKTVNYTMAAEPNRLVITTILNNTVATVSEDSRVRIEANEESDILFDAKADSEVFVLGVEGEYTKVSDGTGIVGFVLSERLFDTKTKMDTIDYTPLVYEHEIRDYKICLAWHQLGGKVSGDKLVEDIAGTKGINVISPTWYEIKDEKGGFTSLASKDYVAKAHSLGLEVWGLISDFRYDETTKEYYINSVINSTTTRRELIKNLIEEAQNTGLDGINIDFEKITSANGEAFVQFIRELSIECRKLDIVLSVDMYVPIESNKFYDRALVGEACDYVIIMGYDEHWGGCDSAGSTASLGFVTNGIKNTLLEVEASRVINAVPFYTRVWKEIPEELADKDAVIIEDSVFGNYALSSFAVGMGTAKKYLSSNGATPVWLEECGQYYGEYIKEGITYRIWLEEKESLQLKLNVMQEYDLGGVACWKLGLEEKEVWSVIEEYLKQE